MPKIKMPAITRVVATGLRMKISGMLIDCRSEEHTSELQSQSNLVCRLLLEKKNKNPQHMYMYVSFSVELLADDVCIGLSADVATISTASLVPHFANSTDDR